MFPWYHGYRGDGDLPEDDRLAIHSIYGSRDGLKQWGPNNRRPYYTRRATTTVATTTTPRYTKPRYTTRRSYHEEKPYEPNGRRNSFETNNPSRYPEKPRYYPSVENKPTTAIIPTTQNKNVYHRQKPQTCNTSYDAVTIIRGEIFIFKGRYLWRIGSQGLHNGYPHEIAKMWNELPRGFSNVDSVYENKRRQIVFFIGKIFKIEEIFSSALNKFSFRKTILCISFAAPTSGLSKTTHGFGLTRIIRKD